MSSRASGLVAWLTGPEAPPLVSETDIAMKTLSDHPDTPRRPRHTLVDDPIRRLVDRGILHALPEARVWLTPLGNTLPPEAWLSALDPLGHLSHVSALHAHGLSDRVPRTLVWTTLSDAAWLAEMKEHVRSRLGEQAERFRLMKLPFPRRVKVERLGGERVEWLHTARPGASVYAGHTRVARVGRTFLDTLRDPDHCGGVRHVLQIWRDHAGNHMGRIVDEIERSGTAIEKVRAGWILEDHCQLSHPVLERWVSLAQRGGSRKLDPHSPYDGEHFSERWCLSLNLP